MEDEDAGIACLIIIIIAIISFAAMLINGVVK